MREKGLERREVGASVLTDELVNATPNTRRRGTVTSPRTMRGLGNTGEERKSSQGSKG